MVDTDENEWPDLDDDYESSSEDEASVVSETTLDQDDTVDSESTSDVDDKDFTLIEDAGMLNNYKIYLPLPLERSYTVQNNVLLNFRFFQMTRV